MKLRKSAFLLSVLLTGTLLFSACGKADQQMQKDEIKDNTSSGIIDYETSRNGVDSNSKNFEENLISGTFYVVHDGIYYPAYTYLKNESAEAKLSDGSFRYVDNSRLVFFTTENFVDVPTLFPGDHLVYYSTTDLLDYITWERYKDLGITFGVRNLQRTTAGKYYIDLTTDEECIIPDSELYDMYSLKTDNVMIDKVGGVVLDEDVVQNGLIMGATKGKEYDMEVYTGTYYKYYKAVANVEAMQAYELFASIGIDTLQDCFWEIDIPDYFVNGYYDINGNGIVRIITEPNYSEETDYNKQLLFPDPNTAYGASSDDYVAPAMYSDCEELNYFSNSTHEGSLGYVDPEAVPDEEKTTESELPEAAKFKEANSKEYDLWFPEGRFCSIKIKSKSGETTGQATVDFENGAISNLSYNRFDHVYEMNVNGKGNTGHLTISGFWYDYEIELTNVEIYNGQDLATNEPIDSDASGSVKQKKASSEKDNLQSEE